jgi:D-alanyl-D-alanine carboxypeptidase
MAKRKKLKKKVIYIGIIIIIFFIIITNFGIKTYKEYTYKKTYEYKLIEHGYTKEQANVLENYYSNDELNDILNIDKNDTILELINQKYYIHKNLARYLTYYKENKDTSYKDIVAIVNVNRDYEYYENDIDSDTSKGSLLIVNKYYKLNDNFEPENLTTIRSQYAYDNNEITEEANDAYVSMWNACKDAGYQLIVNSSYRNYEDQEDVYNSIKASKGQVQADKVAARPGHSEHQTGLAIDVFEINNQLTGTFQDSEAYTWLKENAYLYGYIERYPEDKEYITGYSFESWHWRYVGTEAAKIIHDEDITYDEYYAYYIENQEK